MVHRHPTVTVVEVTTDYMGTTHLKPFTSTIPICDFKSNRLRKPYAFAFEW